MPVIRLDDNLIEYLDPELGDKQTDYFDESFPCLGVRVSSGGTKSWFIYYRFQGRKRRLKIGIYPIVGIDDARQKAKQAFYDLQMNAIDPVTIYKYRPWKGAS